MRIGAALAIMYAASISGCIDSDLAVDPGINGIDREPIINGTPDTIYEGVGAVFSDAGGCTGTAIDANWVLTAAHCVEGASARDTIFFIGRDHERAGETYAARSLHPHRLYSAERHENDIALIEVVTMRGVPTYEYNTSSMSGREGLPVTWVGYGMYRYPDSSNSVRRRGEGHISEVSWTILRSNFEDEMPCSGDSGGPAFATIDGRERVVGVVASGDERCSSYNFDTRVDAFADWIASTMAGGTTPDCDITGGDCDDGVCWPANDSDFICYPSDGIRRGAACDADDETWGSSLPCGDGSICMQVTSDPHDGECMAFCTREADCAGDESCQIPIFADIDSIGVCVPEPEGCGLTDGECPDGEACYPTTSGENFCFPTDGRSAGQSCDPAAGGGDENLPCDDGLVCVGTGGGAGECFELCLSGRDCDGDQECDAPIFRDIPGVGICVPCTDADGDGFCAADDCDDGDRNSNPSASEQCGDGVDNNCDGAIDEGCGGCVDDDGDGYCVEDECNDGNPGINPGAREICNDGIDNDCDGALDLNDPDCGGPDDDGGVDGGPDDDGGVDDTPDGGSGGGSGVERGCSAAAGEAAHIRGFTLLWNLLLNW